MRGCDHPRRHQAGGLLHARSEPKGKRTRNRHAKARWPHGAGGAEEQRSEGVKRGILPAPCNPATAIGAEYGESERPRGKTATRQISKTRNGTPQSEEGGPSTWGQGAGRVSHIASRIRAVGRDHEHEADEDEEDGDHGHAFPVTPASLPEN